MSGIALRALRRAIAPGAAAAALSLAVPAMGLAQERAAADSARPATHTVKPGDTLWSLARLYLGDPFQWPQIFRLNPDVVEDPHWIYPGEVLKIPGRPAGAGAVVAGGPSPSLPNANPPMDAAPGAAEGPLPPGNETATIFASARRRAGAGQRGQIRVLQPPPAVRAGEYLGAPFLSRAGGPSGAGRVLNSVEQQSTLIAVDLGEKRLQLAERVAIVPPSGRAPSSGDRYVAFRLGGNVDGRQVVVPTAVLRVEDTPAGAAPVARIVRMFDAVTPGQSLAPYEPTVPDSIRPVAVEGGRVTKVIGIYGDELVPGMQNFLFFPLTSRDGLRIGDQLTIFREARNDGGVVEPAVNLATVTLVRVTEQGSTGIVIEQSSGRFEAGSLARVSARLP